MGAAALGPKVGIVYYWAGDFEFRIRRAEPTFPDLGYEDVPVYYDEETGRTLYESRHNMSLAAVAEVGRSRQW